MRKQPPSSTLPRSSMTWSAIVSRLVLALVCAALAAGCGKQKESAPPAHATQSCCQCPGIPNEPPADPATFRVAPECQNVSVGQGECEALCKSLGRPGGKLQDGVCSPAPAGAGNACQ